MLDQLITFKNRKNFWSNWLLRLEATHFFKDAFIFIVTAEGELLLCRPYATKEESEMRGSY